jgi:tRNA(fMet)-specific endonuclease VapC
LSRAAADVFRQLRRQKIRIGSRDLKIAAIALAQGALLLSANLRDFEKVPGLRVENWLRQQ